MNDTAPASRANMTADDLFFQAKEARYQASLGLRHHDTGLAEALQYTASLHERFKDQPDEIEALFKHHNVKERKDLDIFGRLGKLVFPDVKAQLRNTYANALRYAERQKKSADDVKVFLHGRVAEIARLEVAARNGARPKPPPPVRIEMPAELAKQLDGLQLSKARFDRTEDGKCVLIAPKVEPKAKAQRAGSTKAKQPQPATA